MQTVNIILCVTDDTRFLNEQLVSIKNQKHADYFVTLSYDGPRNVSDTKAYHLLTNHFIPKQYHAQKGPQGGFAKNFLKTLCDTKLDTDYCAFSDQDDVWEKDKLQRAMEKLSSVPPDQPALYCSRTTLVDETGEILGLSPEFAKPPSFQNALVQSLAGGNTMVLNKAAVNLVKRVGVVEIVSHDWWVYMLVTGVGGHVIFDTWPSVQYRQHDQNLIGGNAGLFPKLKRLRLMFAGRFQKWNTINLHALNKASPYLTFENRNAMDRFVEARNSGLIKRCFQTVGAGVYRQTLAGNWGLALATLLNKI